MTNTNTRIALTNLGMYNEGALHYVWLDLPFTVEKLEDAFQTINVAPNTEYEEYFISDYESNIDGLEIGEYENLNALNELIRQIENLDEWDYEKFCAACEIESDVYSILNDLDDFEFIPDVKNDEELGYYWIDDAGCYDLSAMGDLARYFDYEAFGRDVRLENGGDYVSSGYIVRN